MGKEIGEQIMPALSAEHYARLAEKMEAMGRFSGALAHDFNNIMSGVIGYSSYLKMKLAPEDQIYKDLAMIEQSAERAVDLTRKLMTFAPGTCSTKDRVDLAQAVKSALNNTQGAIQPGTKLSVQVPSDLPLLAGDTLLVAQMIQNLLQNAIESMTGRAGTIGIKASLTTPSASEKKCLVRVKQFPCLCLAISDEGKGMSDEIQSHLFEPFYTSKMPRKGAGLGLAMVYGVLSVHQGDVTVMSSEGKGSLFRVYLPPVKAS